MGLYASAFNGIKPNQSEPSSQYFSGISPRSDNYASQIRGRIARNEWADYKRRFQPEEDALFDMVGNDAALNDAITQSQSDISKAYSSSDQQMQRGMARYGLNMTRQQSENYERNKSLDSTAAMVGAANSIRSRTRDRELGIMGGM